MEIWVDILGWAGAILILAGYALISFRKVEGNSLAYQLMNIFGSIFLAVNTLYYGAIPSSLVNIIWAIIAVFAILTIAKKWRKRKV
jgi:drug/metabolite transporter (DMT)-like permease